MASTVKRRGKDRRGVKRLRPGVNGLERRVVLSPGVLVPSYFYPGTGGPGGAGDGWAAMTSAASTVPITAILNPNSGPGSAADANYQNAITNLENAGGKVVAYVFTDYGNAPQSTVMTEVSTYITQYGSLIDGFFLDGMSTDPARVPYYTTLYSDIKALGPTYQVVGNPGTTTTQDYLQAADTLLTYENNNAVQSYLTSEPAPWVSAQSPGHFANVVYNQPDVQGSDSMQADVNRAFSHDNAGYLYVTERTGANPYSQLPSYWDQEVAAIATIPATALEVTTQAPSPVRAGQTFGLTVTALDQFGNPDPDFNGSVAVAISDGPAGASLGGTAMVTASGGVATFSGLTLDQVGNDTLQVSSTRLTSATTDAINVTPDAATQLVLVSEPPSTVTAGNPLGFEVEAEDQFGNLATNFGGSVTAALAPTPATRR